MPDELLANPLVSAIIGGSIVAFISALLSRRKMQSEIEIQQLLRAYSLLQEAIAFIGGIFERNSGCRRLRIPRQFAIAPASSISPKGESHEPQETIHGTYSG